jgi:molybdopterin-guanine dinucleotide biosynthesis protein A
MIQDPPVTGIVLAGGKSRRMGVDKGLMVFRGKPLVQYSIDLLSLFCDRILISSNNPAYNSFGFEVVADQIAGAGPMGGIAACLEESDTELNLVISCDMPLTDPVIFRTMLELSGDFTFVVPLDDMGRAEPLCAVYKKGSLLIMQKLLAEQNYRMTELYRIAPVRLVTTDEYPIPYHEKWFMNLNTLKDFDSAGII